MADYEIKWLPVWDGRSLRSADGGHYMELAGILQSLKEIAGVEVERASVGGVEARYQYRVRYPIKVRGVRHYVESEGFQTVRAAVSWALSELIEGEFKQ